VNPILYASAIRWSIFFTPLNSPPSPISPIKAVPGLIFMPTKLDTIVTATAKSAEGSKTRKPPTTFKNTSLLQRDNFRRFSITAQISSSRCKGKPSEVRRGLLFAWAALYAAVPTRHWISAKMGLQSKQHKSGVFS
jgi:hypothetical protein